MLLRAVHPIKVVTVYRYNDYHNSSQLIIAAPESERTILVTLSGGRDRAQVCPRDLLIRLCICPFTGADLAEYTA
jgi:hypothetical protein